MKVASIMSHYLDVTALSRCLKQTSEQTTELLMMHGRE